MQAAIGPHTTLCFRDPQVWTPIDNKFFETFSFLPPLSDEEIAKQVDYIVNNGESRAPAARPAARFISCPTVLRRLAYPLSPTTVCHTAALCAIKSPTRGVPPLS